MLTFHFLVFVMLSGVLFSHSVLCYWFSFIRFLIAHTHTFVCSHGVIRLCINAVLNIVLMFLWVSCGKFDFCALPDLKIHGTFMQ